MHMAPLPWPRRTRRHQAVPDHSQTLQAQLYSRLYSRRLCHGPGSATLIIKIVQFLPACAISLRMAPACPRCAPVSISGNAVINAWRNHPNLVCGIRISGYKFIEELSQEQTFPGGTGHALWITLGERTLPSSTVYMKARGSRKKIHSYPLAISGYPKVKPLLACTHSAQACEFGMHAAATVTS